MDVALKLLKGHLSSTGLTLVFAMIYMLDGSAWLDSYLPVNGKPLALFTLVAVLVLHEFGIKRQAETVQLYKELIQQNADLTHQLRVDRLKAAVNAMYREFMASEDQWIESELALKELAELTDERDALDQNSYVQGRLGYLNSRVRRV